MTLHQTNYILINNEAFENLKMINKKEITCKVFGSKAIVIICDSYWGALQIQSNCCSVWLILREKYIWKKKEVNDGVERE